MAEHSNHKTPRELELEAMIIAIHGAYKTDAHKSHALLEVAYADVTGANPPEWASEAKAFFDDRSKGVNF